MKTKEIIICVVTLIVLLMAITSVYASSDNRIDVNDLYNSLTNSNNTYTDPNTNNNTSNNTSGENLNPAPINNNITNNNVIAPINNANSANSEGKDLPETGIDSSIVFIMVICGVSALYAYKKIKDYNIK